MSMLRILPLAVRRGLALGALLACAAGAGAALISLPFSPANFPRPLTINNPLFPLVPGKTFIYRAKSADGCEENHFEVTNRTKTVAGVVTRVVHDIAYEDAACEGRLVKIEDTFDYHAQDSAGNVWYFGEDSRDCTGNVCVPSPGSWLAGVNGARPGIIMLAQPKRGDIYFQEQAPPNALDQAEVVALNVPVTINQETSQFRSFQRCLKTRDFTRLLPGVNEFKYYCPGVGNVAVDEEDKRVELIRITG